MDAFAVAIATGVSLKAASLRQTLRLSWHFGFFQALMPALGWACGLTVRSLIEQYDHWIAFGLLALVGSHMIKEALNKKGTSQPQPIDPTRGMSLVVLSIATSLDALAVGLSLAMLNVSIFVPAIVIGVVAALFTACGMTLGQRISRLARLGSYAEIAGGVVLYAIGAHILHGHGVF
jgi:putative Mn2+ efflux pump MntP